MLRFFLVQKRLVQIILPLRTSLIIDLYFDFTCRMIYNFYLALFQFIFFFFTKTYIIFYVLAKISSAHQC